MEHDDVETAIATAAALAQKRGQLALATVYTLGSWAFHLTEHGEPFMLAMLPVDTYAAMDPKKRSAAETALRDLLNEDVLPAFHTSISYVQLAVLPVKKTAEWQQVFARDLSNAWKELAERPRDGNLLDGPSDDDEA